MHGDPFFDNRENFSRNDEKAARRTILKSVAAGALGFLALLAVLVVTILLAIPPAGWAFKHFIDPWWRYWGL